MSDGEAPSWTEITELASNAHPDAPLDLAIIAEAEPSDLYAGLSRIIVKRTVSGLNVEATNRMYELELSRSDERSTSPGLYVAASRAIQAEEEHKETIAPAQLAIDTDFLRLRLSRPSRWAATLLTALAFGGAPAGGLLATSIDSSPNKPGAVITNQELNKSFEEAAGVVAILGGLSGAFIGYTVSLGKFASKSAHRRARKQVAEIES
jgi:hypothetical protein